MDYIEFRKTMNEKYAKADERQERGSRRRRRWLYPALISLIVIAVIVLAPVAFRLTQ